MMMINCHATNSSHTKMEEISFSTIGEGERQMLKIQNGIKQLVVGMRSIQNFTFDRDTGILEIDYTNRSSSRLTVTPKSVETFEKLYTGWLQANPAPPQSTEELTVWVEQEVTSGIEKQAKATQSILTELKQNTEQVNEAFAEINRFLKERMDQ